MKRFAEFLDERLNEKGEHAVPVNQFFDNPPNLRMKDDIPRILDKLKDHKLHPVQKDVTLRKLIPAQERVDLKKVMKKANRGYDPSGHPIIVLQDGQTKYCIDGHHEASALLLKDANSRVPCTVLDVADVARVLK